MASVAFVVARFPERLVEYHHPARHLPPFVPGSVPALEACDLGSRAARRLLRDLADRYGIDEWSRESFETLVIAEGFAMWKSGSHVAFDESGLRMRSPICPVPSAMDGDPRACRACRAFHVAVAREALGDDVVDAGVDEVITEGAPACDFVLRYRTDP